MRRKPWLSGWGILVVVIVMSFTLISVGYAAETEQITPWYLYTNTIMADLSIDASGNAECYGYVEAKRSDSDIEIKVALYRQVEGVWVQVTSWSDTKEDVRIFELDRSYRITTSGTYKVMVTATITSSSGAAETISQSTRGQTY